MEKNIQREFKLTPSRRQHRLVLGHPAKCCSQQRKRMEKGWKRTGNGKNGPEKSQFIAWLSVSCLHFLQTPSIPVAKLISGSYGSYRDKCISYRGSCRSCRGCRSCRKAVTCRAERSSSPTSDGFPRPGLTVSWFARGPPWTTSWHVDMWWCVKAVKEHFTLWQRLKRRVTAQQVSFLIFLYGNIRHHQTSVSNGFLFLLRSYQWLCREAWYQSRFEVFPNVPHVFDWFPTDFCVENPISSHFFRQDACRVISASFQRITGCSMSFFLAVAYGWHMDGMWPLSAWGEWPNRRKELFEWFWKLCFDSKDFKGKTCCMNRLCCDSRGRGTWSGCE